MKKYTFFILIIVFLFASSQNFVVVKADELSDNISNQLNNLDLTELENFFNQLNIYDSVDFLSYVNGLVNGQYSVDFNSLFSYIINMLLQNVKAVMPIFISIIAISLFCGIMQNFRSSFSSNSIRELINFVCIISIIALILSQIFQLYENGRNAIENMVKLIEIMSPIILTLMLATGGVVSASVYKPTVTFLSAGVANIVLSIILPIVGLIIVLNVLNHFSPTLKFNKFVDFFSSIIKWVLGIVTIVFGVFISIQGITSATFDGISIKATKYAISNSIPIVGGFFKDSFDLVLAGSILIKNAIGIVGVVGIFYIVLSPIINVLVFSLLLNFVSAIINPITDDKISGFLSSMSKCLGCLNVCILIVGLMAFLILLLMMISANAFI